MKLTKELKSQIDNMSYIELLSKWRFAPIGDPMFTKGGSCKYFTNRMKELRSASDREAIHAARRIEE